MHSIYKFIAFTGVIFLGACQSAPQSYNGATGYQVESKGDKTATLAYTLAGRQNQQLDVNKLQAACKKVLGSQNKYTIKVISINEIANPQMDDPQFGRQIGKSNTSFGFSNTKDLYSDQDYATRQALEARPSSLHVVRYTCNA